MYTICRSLGEFILGQLDNKTNFNFMKYSCNIEWWSYSKPKNSLLKVAAVIIIVEMGSPVLGQPSNSTFFWAPTSLAFVVYPLHLLLKSTFENHIYMTIGHNCLIYNCFRITTNITWFNNCLRGIHTTYIFRCYSGSIPWKFYDSELTNIFHRQ